jgi:SAM-dependent methyltransferase
MKRIILDLGCGITKYPNSIGIDSSKNSKADIIFDIEHGIPFPTNQFDLLYSSHTLEHIDPKKLVHILKEMHRVTKPTGKINIIVPHFSSQGGPSNPTHLRQGFSSQLFYYFQTQSGNPDFGKINFEILKVSLKKGRTRYFIWNWFFTFLEFFANLKPLFCEVFWIYWFGGFDEIEFMVKPQKAAIKHR